MKYLLEYYLAFLQEREWNDEDDPGSVHPDLLRKVISQLKASGELGKLRQKHQPSMINVYIKRALGDYRGRADTLNSYRYKKAGIEDWKDAKKLLQKAIDHEKKIKPEKFLKGIITVKNKSKEPAGKEIGPDGTCDDGYADGTSSGPSSMGGL